MLKGIDINQRIEFTSKEDKSEPKTIFIMKPFSGADMIGISQSFKDGKLTLSGNEIIDLIEKSIVEIKNFEGTLSVREIIERLPGIVLGELVNEIGVLNNITGQDTKN